MSGHCYLTTTTVEYYEFLEPEAREYCFEPGYWPVDAGLSDSYTSRSLGSLGYLSDLQNSLLMAGGHGPHHGLFYHLFPGSEPQRTMYEFGDQQSQMEAYLLAQQPQPQQHQLDGEEEEEQEQREQNQNQDLDQDQEPNQNHHHNQEQFIYVSSNGEHGNCRPSDLAEEYDQGRENAETGAEAHQTKRKKRTERNIYRATQGYLVEEPSSDAEDEPRDDTPRGS